jgi:branched-chain amino acid transport system ATP-binding protein
VSAPGAALLSIRGLRVGHGPVEVLHGIDLEVRTGEIVTLIGSNGAGKTTTLMTVAGVHRPREGEILLDGAPIQGSRPHEVVARGLALVPEGRRIFPRLTVRENLEMGAFLVRDRAEVGTRMEEAFGIFPVLRERSEQLGGTLSGGEQQMLAIARALMLRPAILLLDEPSLGLAPLVVSRIFEVIRGLRERGTTVLLVEQNANMALRLADRAYVLETGTITIEGPGQDLLADPRIREAYLGD